MKIDFELADKWAEEPIPENESVDWLSSVVYNAAKAYQAMRLAERALYRAVESLCDCGGMGPKDDGVCDACRIYHAYKAEISK